MALIRSVIHLLWMGITVVPYALAIMLGTLLGVRGVPLYRIARAWLSLCISGARVVLGIRAEVTGMENLPQGANEGAILLVKHQSTYETFLMPVIMPHPLAYVFKKELLHVPFFGWAIGAPSGATIGTGTSSSPSPGRGPRGRRGTPSPRGRP